MERSDSQPQAPTFFGAIACFIPRNQVLVHLEVLVVVCLISVLVFVPASHVFAPFAFFRTGKRFAVLQRQKLWWRHYILVCVPVDLPLWLCRRYISVSFA